jgi:hypothetical protein
VAKVLGEDSTRVIPLWRDQCLVRDGLPVTMRRGDAEDLLTAAEGLVFLGLDGGSAVFTADVSASEQSAVNVSTGNAVRVDLTAKAANQHVWRPDAVGSVCFLVASGLAWFEVCHGWAAWRPRAWSWWITLVNLIGSVAFGVSAVAGYISPATGQLHNAERSNLGTLVGAVCFLAGALLLLPERTEERAVP